MPHTIQRESSLRVLALFRASKLKAGAAAKRLGLGRTRFYEVYGDYLQACARHQESTWTPGVSGGDHAPDWPAEVDALLRKRLGSNPPASYSFAAWSLDILDEHT